MGENLIQGMHRSRIPEEKERLWGKYILVNEYKQKASLLRYRHAV
jgi:hypothetical protein